MKTIWMRQKADIGVDEDNDSKVDESKCLEVRQRRIHHDAERWRMA